MTAKWKEDPRDALDTMTLIIENGKKFKTTKGAPHVILKLCMDSEVGATSKDIATKVEDDVHNLGSRGIRSLAIAKTNDNDKWEMLGMITFLDPPRPDTKHTIEQPRILEFVVYGGGNETQN